jgi:hypothetical protein
MDRPGRTVAVIRKRDRCRAGHSTSVRYMAETPRPAALDYQVPTPADRQLRVWTLILALPVPTVVMAAYLTLTRWPSRHFTAWSDGTALVVSVCAGAALLVASKLDRAAVVGILIVFAPVQTGWLILFGLDFVCHIFGDCL